jgi:hypothetical protein
MAKMKAQHVQFRASDEKWIVKSEDAKTIRRVYDTKLEAVREARSRAKRDGVTLVIHGRDGRIQEIDSYEARPTVSAFVKR